MEKMDNKMEEKIEIEKNKNNEEKDNKICNSDKSDIIKELKEHKLQDYYNGKLQPTIEEFIELKNFIDKSLNVISSGINLVQINEYCNHDINIKNPKQEDFVDLISEIGENKAFFDRAFKTIEGYLKTYDKYIDLLKIYLILLSGKKKTEVDSEISIKLKEYCLKRQVYENILNKVSGSRDAFETKYTVLSRILASWQNSSFSNYKK